MVRERIEAGSFRDRSARVFYRGEEVYRLLDETALRQWNAVSSASFFEKSMQEGKVVVSRLADPHPDLGDRALAGSVLVREAAAVLRHDRIPFITYPYEWCFEMLRDAALLHLQLLKEGLEEGFMLKDATPFNVQWVGTRPVFIDVASFESYVPGEPWVGYRQFCKLFLYPMLLQAYKEVPFQGWLRGELDGIEPETFQRLMSLRDLLRPGVFKHVWLHAKLQAGMQNGSRDVGKDLRRAGFHKELILANVSGLIRLVRRLRRRRRRSQWSEYEQEKGYSGEDRGAKEAFVRRAVESSRWNTVWDLGANVGVYARMASGRARVVVAADADELTVERLYLALKEEGNETIVPLVSNLASPSPGLGWRGVERKTLEQRGRPDLVLALALIHHVVIGANIPLAEFVGWLRDLGAELVIEFVDADDPMVKKLLLNRRDEIPDYDAGYFEACLGDSFEILSRVALGCGTRSLYHARPRGPRA